MKTFGYLFCGLMLALASGCDKSNDMELYCSGGCNSLNFGIVGESGNGTYSQKCTMEYNNVGQVVYQSCTGTLTYSESGHVYHYTAKINYETCKYYVEVDDVGNCGDPAAGYRVPTVETREVNNVTETTARCGGIITDHGGTVLSARGVCWSTAENPTVSDPKTTEGITDDNFESQITGLTPYTLYYVRAYATNKAGTGYGENQMFMTISNRPVVILGGFKEATWNSVTATGIIIDMGASAITARGACWSADPGPTLDDHVTIEDYDDGTFTTLLTGLEPGSAYYVRVYTSNSYGTAYSDEIKVWTLSGSVTDIDGNIYPVVTLGNQEWMASNLKTTHYRDGSEIPNLTANSSWITDSLGAYSWYDNKPDTYGELYGAYYNWYAGTNVRGLCPEGWSVPTDSQWKILESFLGLPIEEVNSSWGQRGTNQGDQLKLAGYSRWYTHSTCMNLNNTAFSALPAGSRPAWDGYFFGHRSVAYFMSTTESATGKFWIRALQYDNAGIGRYSGYEKTYGVSVRCIKNN